MLTDIQREIYSRNLPLKGMGEEGQQKLFDARVLVVGAGGLGSPALLYMAAAGVGTLGIVDSDCVDYSNLQRQILHSRNGLGLFKADSAAERIKALNPDTKTILYKERLTEKNAESIFDGYDFVLDCTDNFQTKFLINDVCVGMKKPFCHGGVMKYGGQCFTYLPEKPCLRCLLEKVPKDAPTAVSEGILGAAAGLLGCVQAMEAIKYILGLGDLLTGRLFVFDGFSCSFRVINTGEPRADCSVCAGHK